MKNLYNSHKRLLQYIEKENFAGYDPYDTLLSNIPFNKLGKWPPILAIQFQKRNPVNIRPLLGIKKDFNPKAMGLLLHSYCVIFEKTKTDKYKETADYLYKWLIDNYSADYGQYCWGYNFPWASPLKYMKAYVPSAVVTGFVCRGLWAYYNITKNPSVIPVLKSAMNFVKDKLHIHKDKTGICFSYTPLVKDVCYNASLLATEILAINYAISPNENLKHEIVSAVNFVTTRQHKNGVWDYSEDIITKNTRSQIDFHQGYVLESIFNIKTLLDFSDKNWEYALKTGLNYYFSNQFLPNGQSFWRLPKKYPIDIHNQCQGIITFYRLQSYQSQYNKMALQIAKWTIENMQTYKGNFYYRINKYFTNKIAYMRWGQAWMLLALSYLLNEK